METLLDQELVGELPLEEAIPIEDTPITSEEDESLIGELNTPKDDMNISPEPDDDVLTAKDLLDDEQFKYSGEMIAFAIDVGASYLLAFIAHQPLAEYRLNSKDLKKLEKVITKCAKDTKLMLSPWQSLGVVLLAIYGMKVPQVIAARREYQALQSAKPTNHEDTTTELSAGRGADGADTPVSDADRPTTHAAGTDTPAGTVPPADTTNTNK